jgi:MurNAc alpha-1-phosphate uridylyltransferase
VPKPLLQVGGKALIVRHIENLAEAGFRNLVINHAHLGTVIEDAIGNGSRFGVTIEYSREGAALETAGGIVRALPLLGDDPFLVVNGDIYCELGFATLAGRRTVMKSDGALAHLVLVDNPAHHAAGDFVLEDGNIRNHGGSRLTFSGIGLYCARLFSGITPGEKAPLAPLLRRAADAGSVTGQHYSGRWEDVGTPQRLDELDRALRQENRAHG